MFKGVGLRSTMALLPQKVLKVNTMDALVEQTKLLITGNKAAGKTLYDCSYGSNSLLSSSTASSNVLLFNKNTITASTGSEIKTSISADFTLLTDFTLEFWFYRTDSSSSGSSGARLFFSSSSGNPGGIEFNLSISPGSINFYLYENNTYKFNASPSKNIDLNRWYFCQIIQDRIKGDISLYLDGEQLVNQPYIITTLGNKLLRFGNVWDTFGSAYQFVGYYADIRYTQAVRNIYLPTDRI